MDVEDANAFEPISNFSFALNFVEKIVAMQFTAHAEGHNCSIESVRILLTSQHRKLL